MLRFPAFLGVMLCTALLAHSGCAGTAAQNTAGPQVDDTVVTATVKKRLAEDPQLAASRIQVETMKGTVQLAGFVGSDAERVRAVQIARSVPDVRDVRNELLVRPPAQ